MWLRQTEPGHARPQLDLARFFYGVQNSDATTPPFRGISDYLAQLQHDISQQVPPTESRLLYDTDAGVDEETRAFDDDTSIPIRARRFSTAAVPPSPAADLTHQFGKTEEQDSDGFT
jgi:hypothetical protein